jgi:iron complex transport system substrate-binding protein
VSFRRRTVLAAPLLLGGARSARTQGAADLLGRQIRLPAAAPRRVVLGDGFLLIALSLLHPDPVSLLAGWATNLQTLDVALHDAYRRRFPALDAVPAIGGTAGSSISAERMLSVAPDLVLFSAWQASSAENQALLRALDEAGVPVAFVDFFLRPLDNTTPSLRLLGQLLGVRDQAEAFIQFHAAHLGAIRQTMAGAPAGPTVLLQAHAGRWACCWSVGSGGVGEYLDLLGSRNIGMGAFPGPAGGALNLEFVIAADPEVYVATGTPRAGASGGISVGPGVVAAQAADDLARVTRAPGLQTLSAIRHGRAHALWNYFSDGPLGIVALEAMAQWLRPELFPGKTADATLAEINRRFAAMPFEGAFWAP